MVTVGGYIITENEADLLDMEKYAYLAKQMGYTAIYVPKCLTIDKMDEVRCAKKVFEKEGLPIAEVGYWQNLMDTRPEVRKANREEMVRQLQLAEELEAGCCVNVTGGYCEGLMWDNHDPKNFTEEHFEETVELARYFIDEVKPKHTTFAFEVFMYGSIDTPEQYDRLIKAVDRDAFAVHLDLTNLLCSPRDIYNAPGMLDRCLNLFADKIVSTHIKDLWMERPCVSSIVHEVVPGEGEVNLIPYIREIAKLPQNVTMMLEHLKTKEEYLRGMDYIRRVVKDEGIGNVNI